jgi:eukaryotic-like serine/threonine-protein kinase
MQVEQPPNVVRFGAFELDLRARELRKNGLKIHLPEQSIQVLAMLLERPGGLVTREEIRKKLWPNDTIVEFDHSINAAVKRLRQALGDSADNPRYIETLARRGYRWLVPVERPEVAPDSDRAQPDSADVSASSAEVLQGKTAESGDNFTQSSPSTLANLIGRKVSHYRVLELVGGGGMGVVYKAEDMKLGRAVALKFLPEELANDRAALERFEREARAASALNHTNICTVYEFGEHEGQPFIAMELLEGQTLKQRIAGAPSPGPGSHPLPEREGLGVRGKRGHAGALGIEEVLELAMQIASGLEAAHEKGVTHRDIKPANIFITTRGEAKILDFGLAKLVEHDVGAGLAPPRAAQGPPLHDSPTVSAIDPRLSRTGAAMGTAAYMSPEQVRGEKVDARTDLFSFGLVLYEMATGQQAFAGKTAAVVQEAILHRTPAPVRQLNSEVPPKLEQIINKALEKDRDVRYSSASDLRTGLKRLKPNAASPHRTRWRLWAMVTSAGAVAAGVVAYLFVLPAPQPRIVNSTQITTDGKPKANIFTDGSRLYFAQGFQPGLYQVSASGGDAQALPIPFQSAALLDVSRDGSEFLVEAGVKEQPELLWPLWILPVLGGSPRRIGDVMVYDASWAPDSEHIIYSNADTLYQVRREGGESRKFVTAPGSPFSLHWSPDGTRLRFSVYDPKGGPVSLWEVWADGTHFHPVLSEWKKTADKCCGIWSPDGKYYVFNGGGNLWAICEKESLLRKCSRDPVQLTATITLSTQLGGPWSSLGPVFSRDGKKIFVTSGQRAVELIRYDAKVRRFASYLTGISADGASFSRDGQWVAYVRVPQGTLWRSKLDGSERLQLTYSPMNAGNPRWTPDGKEIAFQGWAPGKLSKIYVVSSDGGSLQQVTPGERNDADPSWSPDGYSLVFAGNTSFQDIPPSALTIDRIDLRTNQVSSLPGSRGLQSPQWSPSGRYVSAVTATADGQKLMLFDFTTGKWTALAQAPLLWQYWSRDERYCYFMDVGNNSVQRVGISNRKVEQVVNLKEVGRLGEGTFGTWIGLAPDDSILTLRDAGTTDIYALDWEEP